MQYTRPMIDLVYELRRRVDAEMKPSVKMANPELLKELADYHQQTKDTITKTLIKELLFLAGEPWHQLLQPVKTETPKKPELPHQVVKVYRGQTILVEAPRMDMPRMDTPRAATPKPAAEEDVALRNEMLVKAIPPVAAKSVRMYRGQPVL